MRPVRELIDLTGRVALVTGGAGHIGQALSDALAELGASIVVLDVTTDRCEETAGRVHTDFHVDTMPIAVDLANESEVVAVPGKVLGRFGRLDILVNCAAFVGTSDLPGRGAAFGEQSPGTWRMFIEVNLTAPFVLTQACAPALKGSGHGSVVNISSIYGIVGADPRLREGTGLGAASTAYSASKGGLVQLTRQLAAVMAPEVRVNSISLGGVWRDQPDAFHRRYVERTPLGCMATEEDTKGAVAYLASDLSRYVTGHNLVVDGGWTAW